MENPYKGDPKKRALFNLLEAVYIGYWKSWGDFASMRENQEVVGHFADAVAREFFENEDWKTDMLEYSVYLEEQALRNGEYDPDLDPHLINEDGDWKFNREI